jgi:hypothetical protein
LPLRGTHGKSLRFAALTAATASVAASTSFCAADDALLTEVI